MAAHLLICCSLHNDLLQDGATGAAGDKTPSPLLLLSCLSLTSLLLISAAATERQGAMQLAPADDKSGSLRDTLQLGLESGPICRLAAGRSGDMCSTKLPNTA